MKHSSYKCIIIVSLVYCLQYPGLLIAQPFQVGELNITYTDIQHSLFAVFWQRNHLGVMSAVPLTNSGTAYFYDFSSGFSQVFGGSNAHKEMAPGIWGMISADGNADNQVNNLDKNIFWKPNTGSGGQVPQ